MSLPSPGSPWAAPSGEQAGVWGAGPTGQCGRFSPNSPQTLAPSFACLIPWVSSQQTEGRVALSQEEFGPSGMALSQEHPSSRVRSPPTHSTGQQGHGVVTQARVPHGTGQCQRLEGLILPMTSKGWLDRHGPPPHAPGASVPASAGRRSWPLGSWSQCSQTHRWCCGVGKPGERAGGCILVVWPPQLTSTRPPHCPPCTEQPWRRW